MATRDAGAKAIAVLAESVPNLVGGSADLDPSTRTTMKGKGDFQSAVCRREDRLRRRRERRAGSGDTLGETSTSASASTR